MSGASTVNPIAPLDLAAERRAVGPALDEAVAAVLHSGHYVLGPEVERFEREFAALHGVPHGVGVGSGTDALILALRAVGVKPGDRVLTTPFSFFATAGAIAWVGAVPRFADVEEDTGLLDPGEVEAAIDEGTTALLPVHLYGQLADVPKLRALTEKHGLALVEDGAQAHLASRDGIRTGELGDAGTFSFYPTKNLGAAGEGGLVVTRRPEVAEALRRLRDHGSPAKYSHSEIGTNSRLHALQGAVLNAKLPHLATWNERRRTLAARYDEGFAGTPIQPLRSVDPTGHVYHQYTVRLPDGERDRVQGALAKDGIATGVHYPLPIHLQEAARPWGYASGDFPVAESLALRVLCLPIHPFLSDGDTDRVIEALRQHLSA